MARIWALVSSLIIFNIAAWINWGQSEDKTGGIIANNLLFVSLSPQLRNRPQKCSLLTNNKPQILNNNGAIFSLPKSRKTTLGRPLFAQR